MSTEFGSFQPKTGVGHYFKPPIGTTHTRVQERREKKRGGSFKSIPSVINGPSVSLSLLTVLPPPNNATLGTKPLICGPLGDSQHPNHSSILKHEQAQKTVNTWVKAFLSPSLNQIIQRHVLDRSTEDSRRAQHSSDHFPAQLSILSVPSLPPTGSQ